MKKNQIILLLLIYFINLTHSEPLNRIKRFWYPSSSTSESCSIPGNRTGLCKPIHHCFISNLWENVSQFTSTFCSNGNWFSVGICCPNEIEKTAKIIEDPDLEERIGLENDGYFKSSQFQGCGINSMYKPKIMGGRPADPKEWPWMVALLRNRVSNFCGGVLITKKHIISAAHCTNGFKPHEITVRLGEYDFSRKDETESKDFRVVDVKEHPEYNQDTYANDISILKIHRQAIFNDFIRPICLPSVVEDFENKTASVTGWGTQGFGGAPSDILMEVDLPIWSHERCVAAYPERAIQDTMLCAGSLAGRKDSCQGDSGGPLMYKLPNGRWITVGVVSWGLYCGLPGRPGLYTNVFKYIPWIVENTIER